MGVLRFVMQSLKNNALIFYIALPAVMGFVLGSSQLAVGASLPWWASVVFWISWMFICWQIYHIGTLIAAYVLRPWNPPLVAKLAFGIFIASVPARILSYKYASFFEALMLDQVSPRPVPALEFSWNFLIEYLKPWSGVFLFWISTNIFFDKIVGYSRYREKPKFNEENLSGGRLKPISSDVSSGDREQIASKKHTSVMSPFLNKLPHSLGNSIQALKSEDHYVRIYTDKGDSLILYNLGDAIDELTAMGYDGLRVHRSYWVNRKFVRDVKIDGRHLKIRLSMGISVPVSRSYRESVKELNIDSEQVS